MILTSIQEESTQEKGKKAFFLCPIEDYEDLQFLLKGLVPFIVLASALDSLLLHEIEIRNSRNRYFLPT
jgi:hypothetical protein